MRELDHPLATVPSRLAPVDRCGILRALLGRSNPRLLLQMAGMGRYGDIGNAEEVFPENMAHFEAVEML